MIRFKKLCSLLFLIALCLGVSIFASLQSSQSAPPQQGDDQQLIRSLLTEVRLLRLAIEHNQFNTLRMQIVTERINFQQGQVNVLSQRLEDTESELANYQADQPMLLEQLHEMDGQIKQEKDAYLRKQLEVQYDAMKLANGQQIRMEEQLQQRAKLLASKLKTETVKLDAFNDQMNALEGQLSALQYQSHSENPAIIK
jgi:hypothetical protein